MPAFDSYHIQIRGKGRSTTFARAVVLLRTATAPVGEIHFWDSIPPNVLDSMTAGGPVMILPTSMFAGVLDTLRQEGPLRIEMLGSGETAHAVLGTGGSEPVGEEET